MHANAAYKHVNSRYGALTVFANDTGAATQSLLTYGEWAENEITFLQQFVTKGSTVVDAGAYIGTHTLAFAHFVGPSGRVIAIEAQPDTFELLRKNVNANLQSGVQLENAIASCEPAQISIPTFDIERTGSFGSASLLEVLNSDHTSTDKGDVSHHASVAAITLDSLNLQTCALIKVDVEGVENLVLRGAAHTLEHCSPLVYCECNSLAAGLKIVAVLDSVGYKVFAHIVNAFNVDNFFNVDQNIFGNAREVALIGIAANREAQIRSLPVRDCELLLSVKDADDLALALLNKPQYQTEVLRQGRAAKTGGVKFLEEYDASKLELDRLQRENSFIQDTRAEERRVVEQHAQSIAELHTQITQRDAAIADLEAAVGDRNFEIAELRTQITQRDAAIADLEAAVGDRNFEIAELRTQITQRDAAIAHLEATVGEGNRDIAELNILLTQRHIDISQVRDLLTQRDAAIAQLVAQGKAKDDELARMNALIFNLCASTSWKLTSPLRWVAKQIRRMRA